MTNKEELKKDIERARKTQKSIDYFKKKYTRFYGCDLLRIADVLEIADQYDIPIDKMWLGSFDRIVLSGKTGSFEFYIRHSYCFTNRATDYKIDENEWYIHLSFCGCGRLNLINNANGNNGYLYEGEFQTAWEEFVETIKTYNPVQYDDMNHEYFFTVPDGYKLFCDFPEILEKTKNKFKKLNETREIAELKEKLRKLENGNDSTGSSK